MNLCRVPLNLSPSAIWARNGITVAGIGNGTSGDTLNNLSFNYSIYMTHENVLYVTDMDNSRIVLTGPNSKTAIAVIPDDSNCSSPVSGPVDVFVTENYVYVGEMTNFHVLNVLYGLLLDAALTLHIADYGNHRIQRWDYGASCDVKVAGTGALGNISLSNLNFPCAIVVDLNGHMYIVDSGNSTLEFYIQPKDYVKMRKYMVAAEVTESSDDVTKWFERQQNPDMETLVKSLNELYDDHVIELSRRAEIRTYLDSVRRTLDTYEVTKTIDLSGYYPTYYLNFYLATWITPPYYLIATPLFKGTTTKNVRFDTQPDYRVENYNKQLYQTGSGIETPTQINYESDYVPSLSVAIRFHCAAKRGYGLIPREDVNNDNYVHRTAGNNNYQSRCLRNVNHDTKVRVNVVQGDSDQQFSRL
ncbi:unnamed protein product [Rotaria socialis]|uniref:Uncharacterized protein n=2 Tax=Rotaria socialis TaxID=392032 RepID=A0A821LEN2_9BILA|nr:unnamed protein product [Rotaria socialis]